MNCREKMIDEFEKSIHTNTFYHTVTNLSNNYKQNNDDSISEQDFLTVYFVLNDCDITIKEAFEIAKNFLIYGET